MHKIDKNYPIPARRRGPPFKYDFRQWPVGYSELFKGDIGLKARTAAYKFKNRYPEYNFHALKVDTGIRIWRIEVDSNA